MYTPYGNAADAQSRAFQQNLQHPQPQHLSFQQQQYNINPEQHAHMRGNVQDTSVPYANFFQDPAAKMATELAKTGLGSSNQYLQQNFGSFIPGTRELHYYFKVSNMYVAKKILLILFPYTNKNWVRTTMGEDPSMGGTPGAAPVFNPPVNDINAPDLYIPLMSYITYILLWASFQGLKGDFHPQLFGYLASQTIACSFLDILVFKIGLYLLNCSTQSSLWDLVSFSGYKYVTIIALLCWKHLVGGGWFIYYAVVFLLTTSLSLFLMRSLRFLVIPSSGALSGNSVSNSISTKQRRIRIQFLFIYAVVVQSVIILYMSR
ncbi:Piso0_001782 [Millerozyma farinosa CBS 7064]|uniref:Protein YIF1 n=1 Tax=Pichia sorbitophila (strain ATCC MYA-4447 / BCRC 22081 / CBS 7064 / NBRC 10061 / NRRL Y-12695) TaxID=559304 RepID=G8YLQ3_PICSO|nr:Piso0_001782 [Millerozyma farinosa CBS 7064]